MHIEKVKKQRNSEKASSSWINDTRYHNCSY